jgi:glycerol-3-phosphate dehydrogenase
VVVSSTTLLTPPHTTAPILYDVTIDAQLSHLNAERRRVELAELAEGAEVDVLVVGGGVTGAGAALDAASRGLSVALLERRDLATGTSRWSSKLVHGGLRYLAQGDFGVAWESARERAILARMTAPNLVRALPMLTPRSLFLETGIRMGDGLRALAGTSRRRLPSARRVTAEESRRWAPAIAGMDAVLHWDGQLEDDARLVVALARTAAAHGARILTYVEALDGGRRARDALTGETFDVRAQHVINATGVWAGDLAPVALRLSKGAHILLPSALLGDPRAAINVPIPGHRARFVFALPRLDGLVLVGLTDEPFEGPVPDAPPVEAEEEAFLLETLSSALARPLAPADVVGRFAGLRPLLTGDGETADLSRRHAVIEVGGVVTVVGGKLTTYRRMAEDAVDRVTDRPCRTARLPLVGARGDAGGAPPRLVRRFGGEAAELAAAPAELLQPVADGVPALGVEVVAAVEREGALTVEDVLDRRTRLGLVPEWSEAARQAVEAIMAERVK